MRAPNANLLELKRQGGWARWEMVERYSHASRCATAPHCRTRCTKAPLFRRPPAH